MPFQETEILKKTKTTDKIWVCTCGWCAGSAGSPGPESSHTGRAWRRLRRTGRSAAGGSAGLLRAGGRPPWTCPPHPGRSTWEQTHRSVTGGEGNAHGAPAEAQTPNGKQRLHAGHTFKAFNKHPDGLESKNATKSLILVQLKSNKSDLQATF